ncbi:hypothetical protein [Streptomyces antimicrobicus]|uniref:Bulb-type lectin domain-containing protein n=1 Tax=Streptomyces antimicrobicus TaxID=2883108 RepID=A0ABS8B2F6_9ACTN|nr:hypothetical protein [Streptomyces antimicrobicus]MCB5178761.1 hypothetical protein [Streptomyces antimicrobicus]
MRHKLLRRALVCLVAACAVTGLAPGGTGASPAAAATGDPTTCRTQYGGAAATVAPGRRIASGGTVADKVSTVELVMQPDGNLVLYALGRPGGAKLPLWHSGTWGNPGAYALMQEDGNFVVYKQGGGPDTGGALWATGTYGTESNPYTGAYLTGGEFTVEGRSYRGTWWAGTQERHVRICSHLQDRPQASWRPGNWAQSASVWLVLQRDGNLVIHRKSDAKVIWSSGTYGAKYPVELFMEPTGDLVLREQDRDSTVRWHTGTAFNSETYALLQDDGNFVVYRNTGSGPEWGGALWQSGTYDKV